MRSLALCLLFAPLLACGTAEDQGTSDDELRSRNDDGREHRPRPGRPRDAGAPRETGAPRDTGAAEAGACPASALTCQRTELEGDDPVRERELRAAGCDRPFHYLNGANTGLLGGLVSACDDSPRLTTYLVDHHGWVARTFCDACLPRLDGRVYVMWMAFVGPNCPSGCTPAPAWE